ncbi:MAG TPA: hypothetical protein VFH63_08190, partial [candidate division Zixibacteria bacterium]|nr:hypothetical protein [candidate division Zixibacteria bacterium]
MTDRSTLAIAHIPLARRPGRLLAVPLVLVLIAVAGAVGGVLVGGTPGIGLVAGAVVIAAVAAYLAVVPFTIRLDVEVATLRLRWLGGERTLTLARGAVTRVRLSGEDGARLRPRFGFLGWALGSARLHDEETIQLVRLAPTPTIILVPTDRGRFGIAPASEPQLVEALTAAARVQQRLDEVATRARAFLPPTPVPPPPVLAEPEPTLPEPPTAEARPRIMTGIERALLERRLAEERAAALAAAEAER